MAAEAGGESWEVDLPDTAALEGLKLQVDILVNNAGIQTISPIEKFDPAAFRRITTIMLAVPFLLIRAALPHMYAQGHGRIINMSSIHGVTSNCVNPGYVRTALLEGQVAGQAATHGIPEERVLSGIMLARNAIKRLVEPEEVAGLVTWLSSDQAAMVTGASHAMDGGWTV